MKGLRPIAILTLCVAASACSTAKHPVTATDNGKLWSGANEALGRFTAFGISATSGDLGAQYSFADVRQLDGLARAFRNTVADLDDVQPPKELALLNTKLLPIYRDIGNAMASIVAAARAAKREDGLIAWERLRVLSSEAGDVAALIVTATQPLSNIVTAPTTAPTPSPSPKTPKAITRSAAERKLTDLGYALTDAGALDASRPFNAVIGQPFGTQTRYQRQVFFFYGSRYLGNDATDPSGSITFGGRTANEITVEYALFAAADDDCCPTGGRARVRFAWTGKGVRAMDPLPPVDPSRDGSRR